MQIHIGSYVTVQELLDTLKSHGVTKQNYKNIELVLDYGNCYYEGDSPSICANWEKKKK